MSRAPRTGACRGRAARAACAAASRWWCSWPCWGGWSWFGVSLFEPFKSGSGSGQVAVQVPPGASVGDIGDELAQQGRGGLGLFFRLRARLAGKSAELKPGRYLLARNMSYGAALDRLTSGPPAPTIVRVVIPEGRSRRETAVLVRRAGLTGSYLSASARSSRLNPRRYGAPRGTSSLEGFLFPATYELRGGAPATPPGGRAGPGLPGALRGREPAPRPPRAPHGLRRRHHRLDGRARSPGGAGAPADRRRDLEPPARLDPAGHRRHPALRAAQLDAARCAQSELRNPTPFNTRLHRGLPPTPIGSPGLASLQAAANPAHVGYLYYVVRPGTCGRHAFSSTAAKFDRDVARYNAARARSGGRSPTTCKG